MQSPCGVRGKTRLSQGGDRSATSGGVRGQESDITVQAKELLRIKKLSIEFLAEKTGKSYEQVAKDIERDFYMTATEAKEYGIVDKVMPKRISDDGETK